MTTWPVGSCFHEAGHAVVAAALGLQVGDLHVNADDRSGGADVGCPGRLPFIDQVALCFAGLEAQNIWHCRSEHLAGGDDHRIFFDLVRGLPDDWRDAFRKLGYERANDLLCKNKHVVEVIAQQLIERGRLTAADFKHLTDAD